MFLLTVRGKADKVALADLLALRYAFVAAAALIVIGVSLSVVVSQYFLILPLVVAGGLSFSALFGWCPMAVVFDKCLAKK